MDALYIDPEQFIHLKMVDLGVPRIKKCGECVMEFAESLGDESPIIGIALSKEVFLESLCNCLFMVPYAIKALCDIKI